MEIKRYEDWMRPQVIGLFVEEYGVDASSFDTLFGHFYEAPFQQGKGVRIVATEGERVGAFQSFFYWPLWQNGQSIHALQSGNSLVHPDFRGKGLFGKMLDHIHDPASHVEAPLLIGFPVEASFKSFMRNRWMNPFNLQWYVRPMQPVRSLFFQPERRIPRVFGERKAMDLFPSGAGTIVEQSRAFDQYRFAYQQGSYARFHYQGNGFEALFELKVQRRKKVVREVVIGKVVLDIRREDHLKEALAALLHAIGRACPVSMVSIAVNDQSEMWRSVLAMLGFRTIERSIHFIAKGPGAERVTDWEDWWMFRADIDTW